MADRGERWSSGIGRSAERPAGAACWRRHRFLFRLIGARSELRVDVRNTPIARSTRRSSGVLSRSDISGWRMVFFIPWRGSPKSLARRISTCAGRLGWGAGFLFGDIPVRGPPLELGRSERPTLRPLWSYGVIDDSTPVQQLR